MSTTVFKGSIRPGEISAELPRHTQAPSLAGTPAQGHAVPSVQPAGVASGSIAAVGTNAGTDAIAAISVNPAVLALGEDASRRLAAWARISDLTVFIPISQIGEGGAASDSKTPKYFGVRARWNWTGARAGDEVWTGARTLFEQWLARASRNDVRVKDLLSRAPDLEACAKALVDGLPEAAVVAGCGSAFTFDIDLAEAARLRDELAKVRRAADARYFGVDLRFDQGDPTLGEQPGARGTYLFGGFAFGRKFGAASEAARTGFRARLGLRHAKLDAVAETEFAAEGAAGFEFSRDQGEQEINGSIALEFRHGNAEESLLTTLQTNAGVVRGSFVLPVAAGNSMSLNAGIPIWGGVSPTLSVNFNWGLLLSGGALTERGR